MPDEIKCNKRNILSVVFEEIGGVYCFGLYDIRQFEISNRWFDLELKPVGRMQNVRPPKNPSENYQSIALDKARQFAERRGVKLYNWVKKSKNAQALS